VADSSKGDVVRSVVDAVQLSGPTEIVLALDEVLTRQLGTRRVELLVVDYRLAELHPVGGDDAPQPVDGSPAGRCFASQRPEFLDGPDGHVVYVPISVRGDRLGVLVAALPEPPDQDLVEVLRTVGRVVGHEVVAASRTTDWFAAARRSRPLTVAAEAQWDALPGRAYRADGLVVAGQLEPAYRVAGDTFDWAVERRHVHATVIDAAGSGVDAALVTTLALSALRNARRQGLSLADQACLTDQAVYARFGGERHLAMLLVELDLAEGVVHTVTAGAARMYVVRGRAVVPIDRTEEVPIGMFDGTIYKTEQLALDRGDRLITASDGLYNAAPGHLGTYGEVRLRRELASTRHLSCEETVRAVVRDLLAYHDENHLNDDAVIVGVDWQR